MSEEWLQAASRPRLAAQVDPSVPNVARVWNYLVGGRDNFEADRQAAKQLVAAAPVMEQVAPASRAFLCRAVTYLAADAGIRQFLDIGTGIPTAGNTHEVAQAAAPESRVVYVDYDPVVLAHARALLVSGTEGATDYIDADLRDTESILIGAAKLLDFSRPVAVTLISILHAIPDADDPHALVARLMDAVPPGSYLALSHAGSDLVSPQVQHGIEDVASRMIRQQLASRTREEVARFFAGTDLVEPGLVRVEDWRPDPAAAGTAPSSLWCAVGRKR